MSIQRASSFLFKDPTTFFVKSRKPQLTSDIFALPEKFKGGRIEKFVNYWKGVKDDYYEAFQGKLEAKSLRTNLNYLICVDFNNS